VLVPVSPHRHTEQIKRQGKGREERSNVRNICTSEKDPVIRSSSPKILAGGQLTRAALG
jgi:hypothetical protein